MTDSWMYTSVMLPTIFPMQKEEQDCISRRVSYAMESTMKGLRVIHGQIVLCVLILSKFPYSFFTRFYALKVHDVTPST